MTEVKDKAGVTDPEGKEVDAQEVLGDAILGKGEPTEKPKGEPEKPAEGDQKEKVEEKAEKEEEKAKEKVEEKAPDPIEAQTQKLLKQFKDDPKELAKALANKHALTARHDEELGQLRKRDLEYDLLIKKMREDPEGLKRELDAAHSEKKEEDSLLDRAYEDPKVLPKYIAKEVSQAVSQIERNRQTEEDLAEVYPDYKQTAKQRETVAKQIELGRFSPQELQHLVVRGYYLDKAVEDAKKLAIEEQKNTLAKKEGEQIEKQGVLTGDKELDLTDEDVKQDVLGDAILKAKR